MPRANAAEPSGLVYEQGAADRHPRDHRRRSRASTSPASSKAPRPPIGWCSKPSGRATARSSAFSTGDEVRSAFEAAIAEREAAGHVLDNRLVAIERAAIEDARLDGKVAEIEVRFDAFVAAVTRDKEGELVAGSLTDAVPTNDIWTFRRDLKSRDPNWRLVETDEAA